MKPPQKIRISLTREEMSICFEALRNEQKSCLTRIARAEKPDSTNEHTLALACRAGVIEVVKPVFAGALAKFV